MNMAPHNGCLDDNPHGDAYRRAIEWERTATTIVEHLHHHRLCDNNHPDGRNNYSDRKPKTVVQQLETKKARS